MVSHPDPATFELSLRDPMFFRERLHIDVENQDVAPFGSRMADFQRKDFEQIDPCLMWLAGRGARPEVTRFWIQRGRGHSKTSDMATSMTWLLLASQKQRRGICVAEDKRQAALMWDQMEAVRQMNPWLNSYISYQKGLVINKVTGTRLEIWSSDVASSWGIIPDFVVADELTHWTKEQFWSSVVSSYEKRKGMLAILCNAGFGRDWRWNLKQHAITSHLWYHSSPEGLVAPWITDDSLKEQRAMLPYVEFARLWLNQWQESGGEFVTLAEADACQDANLFERDQTENDGWPYIASVDYAEKHDRTVGTVMHRAGSKIIVDRMDVICPQVYQKHTKVSWCKRWMQRVQKQFGARYGKVYYVIDKYQLIGVREELESEGFDISEFEFASGLGNYRMAVLLRQLILSQRIKWYPGCGRIVDGTGEVVKTALERDDLSYELSSLVVKNYSNGKRWRFDHPEDRIHHDDRAYALGAGALFIVENSGGFEDFGVFDPSAGSQIWSK